jgi:hypothetical protein
MGVSFNAAAIGILQMAGCPDNINEYTGEEIIVNRTAVGSLQAIDDVFFSFQVFHRVPGHLFEGADLGGQFQPVIDQRQQSVVYRVDGTAQI